MNQNIYNVPSTKYIEVSDRPINTRAKLDTGTHCNYECGFCYYLDKLNERTDFNEIKKRIDYIHSCGIKEIDLSGGESSIHKDWFKILDYCKSKGLRLSCLSNGYKFADKEFIERSKEHGLEEILFSLHGSTPEIHDSIVGKKGAFYKMLEAIINAHELGIIVRINCTVTRDNYKELSNLYSLLILQMTPAQVNFLTLNHWDNAGKLEPFSYADSTPEIQKCIDKIKDYIPDINVRYTPYCFMEGYEKYVVGTYHHIHDLQDWNIAVYNGDLSPEQYKGNEREELYKKAKLNRLQFYAKQKECLDCKYYNICDGYEKQIKDIPLKPIQGTKISNLFPLKFK